VRNKDKQNRLRASVLALAIAAMPLGAHAAGLGRLTVVSALGQPLRAEIEVVASQEEYSSLSARLASPDAFKNAGIEYSSALTGIRFTLDRRADGRPFLKVSSDRPLNEPFVDMLVEANWASGRLVREYTFLLDPPDVFRKPPAPTPIAAPEVKPEPAPAVQAPKPAEPPRVAAPAEAKPFEAKPAVAPAPTPKPAAKAAAKPAEATREVMQGDTLGKIASETKPEGVNLDQMLVALFRSNEDAFIGGNMNRLRAGKILTIPDRDAVVAVDGKEARSVVVAQAADFNAYRQKLASVAAAAPARDEAPKQLATGKIAPRVEDKVPAPPAGSDKLEVSRSQGGKPGVSGKDRVAAVEEDLIAREKALKDANARIAELEKNLNDLKRLAELRSAGGARLQEQAKAAQAPAPAQAPKSAEPPKPADATSPSEAPAAAAVLPPTPPAAAPKPAQPAPPPPPPPSFIEDNPELVFGGAGIVALLLGYLGYNAWRRKRKAADDLPGPTTTGEAAASVFGTTGGQTVDTGEDLLPTDFSQDATADLAGDEGVDPVAEADVYIAYGRDTQAEEILLEAMKNEPARAAIHLKLLEIYAARKSLPQFHAIARDLNALTAGMGAEWEKAAALGRSIDPNDPLYGGVAAAVKPADEMVGVETQVISPEAAAAAVDEAPAPEASPVADEAPAPEEIPQSLDFDLDLGEASAAPAAEEAPAAEAPVAAEAPAEEAMSLDFDLDLGTAPGEQAEQAEPVAETASAAEAEPEGAAALDFDLDLGAEPTEAVPAIEVPAEPAADANSVDFNLDLGSLPEAPAEDTAAGVASEHAGNTMDFDLDLPAVEAPAEESAAGLQVPAIETGVEPALDMDLGAEPAADAAPELPPIEEPPIELPPIEEPAAEAPLPPALDLSSIDLELGEPEAAPVAEPPAEPALPETTQIVEDNPEVATKLELAQAYEEMGDKEGARELLNEVIAEGSPSQQQFARDRLAQLG